MIQESCLQRYQQEFHTVFTGLGKRQQEHQIRLAPDATLFSITAQRRVPYPLRLKVQAEIKRMEKLG